MYKPKDLSIYYKKHVHNLSNQGKSFHKKNSSLHKMSHTRQNAYAKGLQELKELELSLCDNDNEAQNYDLEMYLNWLGNDEFT